MTTEKILIVPDSFKGSLSSREASEIIKKAITDCNDNAEITVCPLADGGEGTVDAFLSALGGEKVALKAHDPLMRSIHTYYGLCGDTAVIEAAAASGLTLLKEDERNPLKTTTFGTGEIIKKALDRDVKRIIIGIGGSATNDCGAGCLRALGVKFKDEQGKDVPLGGENLIKIAEIDISGIDRRIFNTEIIAACDVTSPLYGENGASKAFAKQKGASEKDIETLESAVIHFSEICKKALNRDFSQEKSTGAAGGLAFALLSFLNARILSGFDILYDVYELQSKIKASDLIITGEGKTDSSSLLGKLPVRTAQKAKEYGKPVMLLSGDISCGSSELKEYFTYFNKARLFSDTVEAAIKNAKSRLYNAACNSYRMLNTKTVFIDFDNTVVDFDKCSKKSMKDNFKKFGYEFKDEMFETFTLINNKLWKDLEKGILTKKKLREIRWNTCFEALGINGNGEEFEEYFENGIGNSFIPIENALELLAYLKEKYRLCLVTNGFSAIQRNRLKISGLDRVFDDIFISEELGFEKPSKEFFDKCFEGLSDIKKETAVIIGDSLSSDIKGGKDYGLKTVWFNRKNETSAKDEAPDFTVNDLSDIMNIL